MKKIITIAVAGLFLATSLGLAQEEGSVKSPQATLAAKHKRVHTRPPYSGPTKAVKKADYKHPNMPPKPKEAPKQGTAQAPAGQIIVR